MKYVMAAASFLACALPVLPAEAQSRWTGFHLGVHGGYNWADFDRYFRPAPGSGFLVNTYKPSGSADDLLLGAQLGASFLAAPYLILGAEADFAWTSFGDFDPPAPFGFDVANPDFGSPGHVAGIVRSEVDRLATLRARVGYDAGDWLPYVTAGLAFGRVRTVGGYDDDLGAYQTMRGSKTQVGWTVGAGVEVALAGNLSFKAEYSYVDLGTGETYTFSDPAHGDVNAKIDDVTLQMLKFGFNYRF